MPQRDDAPTRRSFLEKVALAAGIAAGGILGTLKPETAQAATGAAPPSATDLMNSGAFGWPLLADAQSSAPATLIANPNILMIVVDQLRLPQYWLNSSQQLTVDSICPNTAWLRKTSYRFLNFYVCAQSCTPSRATLLTGLHAPQTGMFATQSGAVSNPPPDLNPGLPTFATALQDIAGYEAANIMWFGKWHLSNQSGGAQQGSDTLPSYGFSTGRSSQILWPSYHGSPNGTANEGNNGYLYDPPNQPVGTSRLLGCDDSIANDFVNNWTNNPPVTGKPWFACVSFVNPHDIQYYPGFFPPIEAAVPSSQGVPGDPTGEPADGNFQPHYANYITGVISGTPAGFNYEGSLILQDKSWDVTATKQDKGNFLQPYFQQDQADADANLTEGSLATHATPPAESDYTAFFNWYYYMLQLVDANIGTVLSTAIPGYNNTVTTNPSSNTAIIFLSDHGDYGGSHGLHAKGGAVYDESLRVPLYVVTPSQSAAVDVTQMCSMVDIFMLVVELALGAPWGSSNWQSSTKYQDQYYNMNESMLSFIQSPLTAEELRGFWDGPDKAVWYPFILTTVDETRLDAIPWKNPVVYNVNCALRNHVMCMRTKSDATHDPSSAYTGGKLALYSKWILNPSSYSAPIVDGTLAAGGTIVQDYEYYDYLNYNNRGEVSYTPSGGSPTGSDYPPALAGIDSHGVSGSGAGAKALLNLMAGKFGNMQIMTAAGPPPTITPASGFVATILTRQLTGVSSSVSLSTYTADGIQAWYTWLQTLLQDINSGCTE